MNAFQYLPAMSVYKVQTWTKKQNLKKMLWKDQPANKSQIYGQTEEQAR